jgi:hypothetical protein
VVELESASVKRSAMLSALALLCAACVHDSRDPALVRSAPELRPSGVFTRSWGLCSLLGPRAHNPGVWGSDLGFSATASDADPQLHLLFGDTWAEATPSCHYPVPRSDDLQAWLPATRPAVLQAGAPRGHEAEACRSLRYARTRPDDVTSWQRSRLFPNPIASSPDAMMDTGALRTPVAVFSNGERLLAVFHHHDPALCDATGQCPSDMICSADPGYTGKPLGECANALKLSPDAATSICRDADDCLGSAACKPARRGVCLARKPFDLHTPQGVVVPTWYRDDPRRGIAQVMYVAAALGPERPADYGVVARFVTNRFQSLAARTIRYFDPEHPSQNDYRPGHHTLLLWGRQTLAETGGAQSLPFLLYQSLDALRGEPSAMRWHPHFFAGYGSDGRVRWSERESEAQPVYGSEARLVEAGGPKLVWAEPEFDYVNQMTVSWVAALGRWVMFYGGDVPAFIVMDPRTGAAREPVHLQWAPGAIHLRAAAHPWGRARADSPEREAWSSAEPMLTRQLAAPYLACGDRGPSALPGCLTDSDPATALQTLGALSALGLSDPGKFARIAGRCVTGDITESAQAVLSGNPVGRLYGANILDEWSEDVTDLVPHAAGERAVELYWNASTWNPYQVVLWKTLLRAEPLR